MLAAAVGAAVTKQTEPYKLKAEISLTRTLKSVVQAGSLDALAVGNERNLLSCTWQGGDCQCPCCFERL